MKQTWKRLLSLLLACVLVVSALPLSASAQVSEPSAATKEWVSGICQNNYSDYDFGQYFQLGNSGVYWASAVKYQQTAEGVVTDTVLFIVPGEGATGEDAMMPDYNSTPELWAHGNVSALYIGDGVAGIGDYAFYNIPTLEKVVIEDSADLTKVGEHAFDGCDNLVGPLDLSNVTTLGQYAFNNCERLGSGENNTGVTLSDNLAEIPKNAFYNCALKKVNIPESCTKIGEGAFAHNSLSAVGELVLPDGLQSIGDSAFYRQPSESTTMQGITSLVIPASVTYIGENAFYGIKSLSQVELKRITAEGLEIENGAFGNGTMSAYSKVEDVTIGEGEHAITYEDVHKGAEFLTHSDEVADLLDNGVNCYLGDLKPLEYKGTVKPTCEEPGYHVYIMTLEGVTAAGSTESKDVEVETEIEIPAVRHDYVQQEDEPATCELPARKHWKCMNVENGKVEKCETPDRYEEITGSMPLGHNYQVTNVENPLIAGNNNGNTVITYTCANAEKDLHDGDLFPSYSWEIKPTTAIASTSNTLREVQLPQVSGSSGNHYTAELQWNEDEDKLDELLTDGENEFNVKLVVTSTTNSFPPYTSEVFKLKVQVDKVRLDFSDVQFQNNIRYVAQTNGPFGVRNLPKDANITKTEYSKDGQKWETTAPADTEENKGNYQVRVTFTYTSSKYLLDTENSDLLPPMGYTLAEGETLGIGTITGPYEIKQLTAADLRVSPIENLTYDGEKHNTVQIDGVPVEADVTVQWKDQEGNPQTETYKAEATSMSVAGITNAGTYDVTITVKHGTFTGGSATKEAQGVIAKREIPTPKANRLQAYTPELTQTGVADPTGEYEDIYTVEKNKQINAGTYEAIATLADSNNYKWSTSDEAEVKISYTIPRRSVYKPTQITEAYTYDGGTKMPLTGHNGTNMEGKFDDDGTLTAYWKAYPSYTVFTATYAQMTDAGDYTITVSLNNTEGAQNYQWSNPSSQEPDVENFTIEWRIIPADVQVPEVTVANTTYDGHPYNTDSADITLTGQSNILMLGTNHKYYTNPTGESALGDTPVDAGTYWVEIDFDFAKDKNPNNYTIVGNDRQPFTINKANLTLTAPEEDQLTKTYTGQAITVPAPTISDYPDHGEQNAALTYTYRLKDSDDAAKTAEGELKLTDVGTYAITVKVSDSCQNYTSGKAAEYTFTINAANQTVELTSTDDDFMGDGTEGKPYTITKTLGDKPFTVTGTGYVGDTATDANITYESSDSDTATVDEDGKVTLKKATAEGNSVTITVKAAGSENYGEATATYTITVGKGTPTVTVQMPGEGTDYTYPYTGNALTFAANVAGASNGAVAPTTEGKIEYEYYSDDGGEKGDPLQSQPTEIGTYWVEAVYTGDVNYEGATSKAEKFTISPAALGVKVTGYNDTYDGQPHDPAKSITVTGVGDRTFAKGEYTVYYAKKTEGQESAPEDSSVWSSTLKVKDVADSGEYWVKVVINGDNSYNAYVSKEPITVTISRKKLQIEKKVTARKTYDGTKKATVTFEEINTDINGETVNVTDTIAEYNSADVNDAQSITITYTLEAGETTKLDNYIVSTDGKPIVDGSATETVTEVGDIQVGIYPASITVAISDQTSVYDGQEPEVGQEKGTSADHNDWYVSTGTVFSQGETEDNLGITLSIASDSDAKDAGDYAITGEWTNTNYDVTFTGSWKGEEGDPNNNNAGTYTITHRPISVQIGNAEGFYGDEPDKTKVELTDISESDPDTGLVSGDSLDDFLSGVTIDATASTGVGNDYSIFGTAKVYDNYDVTFSSGTYTVKARPITITINDHSSDYGEAIDGGIASPVSGEDYTVAITEGNTTTTEGAIVNNDNLGITLTTTAQKGSDAGTYSISGATQGDVVANYAITWKGETAWNGSDQDTTTADSAKGTYTIEKAQLKISVDETDIFASFDEQISNPLTFTNGSLNEEISSDDPNYNALSAAVVYTISPADGLKHVEGSTNADGKFTVAVTQQVITVKVKVTATDNYEAAEEITYYVHTSASGSLTVDLPFAGLTYTSEEQKLLTGAPTLPDGVVIRYSLNGTDWTEYSDDNPDNWKSLVGTNAGDYTVYWETEAGGNYSASSGHETTEIQKANLKATYTGLKDSEVTLVLSVMGDTYIIPLDLTGNAGYTHSNGDGVTFLSGNTDVAFAKNSTATLELRGVAGEAKITINCPGDANYNPGTFTFTVTVTDEKAQILYSAPAVTETYDGQPHTIQVQVTEPDSGATVLYADQSGDYTLTDPPAYTDVKDGGYPIKFQITAPGYETKEDTATLTINPKTIDEKMVTGIAESYTYVNSQIRPETVAVVDGSVILKKDTDYTIDYGENKEVGTGSVTIKGTGNYTGEVTKDFAIKAVDGSDLTASLDRTFGYYGDSDTDNATVKVMHGNLHEVDSSEIELTVTRKDDTSASSDVTTDDLKLTFNQAGIYTIHVEVSGTHTGEFDLTYTLLPQDVASANFQVTTEPENRVWTYNGENHAFDVTVTSGGTSLQKDVNFALRYTYLPYVGSQEEGAYDPDTTAFTEAGIYTVIVEGTGNYTGHAELVALIQPRDLSDAAITAAFDQNEWVYNGNAQEPEVTLTYNGTEISQLKKTEYYGNINAGEAQALSAAGEDCNNFTGVRVDGFTIQPKSLKDESISATADPDTYYYTGYPITPNVTVSDTDRDKDLSIGADFTITSQSTEPGTGTATIQGTGNYKDEISVTFTILPTSAQPAETLKLTVNPTEWTWDNGVTKANISVTFNKVTMDPQNYVLAVSKDGQQAKEVTIADAVTMIADPGTYTITAMGKNAYNGSTDTETVTIRKIQPELAVTANPDTLSGSGKVTLTLEGKNLPAFAEGEDLSSLLTATAKDEKNAPDLSELEWETDEQTGVMTAELTLPNTSEAYTFTLNYPGNDYYESATASKQVVVAQQIISGGGGGGPEEDQPANPDDTGVSDWLNTKEHLAYLAGYPGGVFGPDQNMTRAEAAQMFYNLLLEKDVEITVEFEDVPEDAWYATSVNSLASLGFLSGVGEGRFDPDRSITRAEFTVIAMKFANAGSGGVNIFSDVSPDDWFYSAVVDSTQYGWINGYTDGTFRPAATITRAEVTVIVNHMLGRAADREYVIAHQGELNSFSDVNRGHWGYYHVAEATNAHTYQTDDGTESWIAMN